MQGETPSETVGIIAAIDRELQPTIDRLGLQLAAGFFTGTHSGRRIAATITGMGWHRAEAAIEHLIRAHQPKRLISVGFAGGLDTAIDPGEVVRVKWILDAQGDIFGIGETTVAIVQDHDKRLREQSLFCAQQVVDSVEEKRRLFEKYRACAVDMESIAVAKMCRQHHVKLALFRGISDPADMAMPPEAGNWVDTDGSVKTSAATMYMLTHPWKIPTFLRLQSASKRAAIDMAELVEQALLEK